MTDTTAAADAAARPEGLPANFENVQALADAHLAATQKITAQGQAAAATTPPASPLAIQPAQQVSDGGLQAVLDKHREATNAAGGVLQEAALVELEGSGVSREMAQQWQAGQQAQMQLQAQEVFATVGGEEKWNELVGWMTTNLSEVEINGFNAMLDSPIETVKMAVQGMQAKHQAAVGTQPTLLEGSKAAPQMQQGFASVKEFTTAISDEKYSQDPAYRKAVEAKLANSPQILGMTGLAPGGGGTVRTQLTETELG